MSLLILIHRTKAEDARDTRIRLFEQLIEQCQGQTYIRSVGQSIDVGPSVTIIFRSGEKPSKIAGLRPDYYYSDDVMVASWIAQGAAKIGGKEIYEIDQVLFIVSSYIGFKNCVGGFLGVGKEKLHD